jgi:5-hydroxyisourate hydrolase
MGATPLETGTYRLTFTVGEYFRELGVEAFYPTVEITFEVRDAGQHYHVPLLVSPFGYSTYRGS